MKPLIVAALADEVRILKSKMVLDCVIHFKPAILYRGQFQNRDINLLVTGMGRERMRKGLEAALQTCEPDTILAAGYCGGASPVAALGALILAAEAVDFSDDVRQACDGNLLATAKKICEEEKWPYQVGGLVTVDRVITSPYEKADIGVTAHAMAIDMEAAVSARLAAAQKIPFLAVKSVLDPMEMMLPHFEGCLEPTGEASPSKLLDNLIKTPANITKLPELQYCAFQARKSLAEFLERWLAKQ